MKAVIRSGENDISKNCRTCMHSRSVPLSKEWLCDINGVVFANYCCDSYEYDDTIKRPSKRRFIDADRFSKEDFSID